MNEADPIMKFFEFEFSGDDKYDEISKLMFKTAKAIEALPRNAERSTALRKLLECRDAARRACE